MYATCVAPCAAPGWRMLMRSNPSPWTLAPKLKLSVDVLPVSLVSVQASAVYVTATSIFHHLVPGPEPE